MRFSLSINGDQRLVAGKDGPGYLNAHLNLHDRPKDNDVGSSVQVKGIQTLETETKYLEWTTYDLQNGDAVELRLLPDGDGDPPIKVRRSSESPQTLFSNATSLAFGCGF
jgi:hypothetical protein